MQKKEKSIAKVKIWYIDGTTQTDIYPENEHLRKRIKRKVKIK